jgi:hypothetical protein
MTENNDNLFPFVLISLCLHLVLGYLFLFGSQLYAKKLPQQNIVSVEMISVKDIANIPTKKAQKEKPVENQDAKKSVMQRKILQSTPIVDNQNDSTPIKKENNEPKISPKPQPIKEVSSPRENQALLPDKKIEPEKQKPLKEELKKNNTPIPVVKKEEKKKPKNPVKENKQQVKKNKKIEQQKKVDLDSLLKNLEESSDGNNSKSNKYNRASKTENIDQSTGNYNENLALSIDEITLIRSQIIESWNILAEVKGIEGARIILYIAINQDGSINTVQIKDKICPNLSNASCNSLADSAVRAVYAASPIKNLDISRYNLWKEFNMEFNPEQALGLGM